MCGCNANKKAVVFEKAATVSGLEQKIASVKSRVSSFENTIGLFTPIEQDIMAADYYPYPKLEVNSAVLKSLYSLSHFSFVLPNQNGILMKLNVCEHSIYADGGKRDNERYFHGVIDGVESFVSLSIFQDKFYGVISYEEDSLDIVHFSGNTYRMIRNADVPFQELKCDIVKKDRDDRVAGDFKNIKVSVHWDVTREYDEGYLKAVFAVVKTVYENEGIAICLDGISLSNDSLESYKNVADVSQLLDFKSGEEGTKAKANFNTLCVKNESFSYTELVENSLTLNATLLSHNLGHNFGAEHTAGDCGTANDLMGFCHNGRLPLLMIGFNTDTIRIRTGEFVPIKLATNSKVVSKVVPRVAATKVVHRLPTKVQNKVVAPKVEAQVEPQVEAKVEAQVEGKVEPLVEPLVAQVVEAKVEPQVEPKVEAKVEPKVTFKVDTPQVQRGRVPYKVPSQVSRVQKAQIPIVAKPQVKPQVTQPQVTQPQVIQPQVTQPQVTQPQVTQPQVTQPQIPQMKPALFMVKERKGKVYKREVSGGEVVELKLKGKKYRQLSWEVKDKSFKVHSSHPSGSKFYKGDTVVSHRITNSQGQTTDLQLTIRVVRK